MRKDDGWILVRAIEGLGKRIAHLWHDLSEKVEVERVVALLDAFCGATRRVRQFKARGEVHGRRTHSPALALNEIFVGWRSSWRVFSWMSGRFIVTYSTFCARQPYAPSIAGWGCPRLRTFVSSVSDERWAQRTSGCDVEDIVGVRVQVECAMGRSLFRGGSRAHEPGHAIPTE